MERPSISFLVPAFNEEQNIASFYNELSPVLATLSVPHEVIFVDDASTDQTSERIAELCRAHPSIRGIQMLRNSRKGGALEVGFREAKGEIIVTLDADLQDDPREIPALLAELDRGADVVIGWKKDRKDPLSKKFPSFIMNLLASVLFRHKIHDMNTGLKAYRSSALRNLALPGSLYRFIPLILLSKGYRIVEIPVHHRKRQSGESKFGFGHRFRALFDFITVVFIWKFGERPLHFFGGCGFLFFFTGLGIGVYLTVLWLQGIGIGGRPLLLLSVLFMVLGIQLISTGLVGELFLHSQDREKYLPPYSDIS